MALFADAQPEKRLFISLLTRDISLADAILDLIDNSVNSAIIESGREFRTPEDYLNLLEGGAGAGVNLPSITVTVGPDQFVVKDTCGGISLAHAEKDVFRFGRETDPDPADSEGDTLSVYGIGLKRAIFKIGNRIKMRSAHPDLGFQLDLDVRKWERQAQARWQIPIEEYRGPPNDAFGTEITILDIYPDIAKRISDGAFVDELVKRIGRTYCYFLQRVVKVIVNGKDIEPIDIKFRENRASDSFSIGEVSCAVIAGISIPAGKFYTQDLSGWYVFCNGREVAYADKTPLTGWGLFLPVFQPKHRPFAGLVFFTSHDPEKLPWTTTKSSVNQESAIWQHALRIMGTVGKQITGYLDSRYTSDGTEISTDELTQVGGGATAPLKAISSAAPNKFVYTRAKADTTSIQFSVKLSEVAEVKDYLGKRSASNGEVGRYVFDYFIKNVVRE